MPSCESTKVTNLGWTIYTAPLEELGADQLRGFLDEQRRTRLFIENTTLELKRERTRHNVTTAIAAMANAAGGIILVGVDEHEPDFESAPGVDAGEGVSLLEACHGTLSPRITPEITTVAIPGKDKVILVVRVEADPALWPVVKQGQVFVRNYGQSCAATHDQILLLVERRTSSARPSGTMFAVSNVFASRMLDGEDRTAAADLVVRAATAVYTRPLGSAPLVFGREVRDALDQALQDSTIVRLGLQNLGRGASAASLLTDLDGREWSSTRYRVTGVRPGLPESQQIVMTVQRSGNQVAFALEAHLRLPRLGDAQAPRVGRAEVALVLLCTLETIIFEMTPAIVQLAGGAPSHVDNLVCWVESQRGDGLSFALDFDRVDRPVPQDMRTWSFQLQRPEDIADIARLVRDQLRVLYLDLGVDDDESVAAEDVRHASSLRSRLSE
ncbi:RNA-binding domain-containing protein [Nocardioides sp. 503]|uniref:RNA-binding domain-containing protein n=1 Tax=Nocardioides sp. 503 TaxID=2508326 RepID=UPI001FD69D90|nr:RNA-binding domain-containing protein [Nocardioides sp. 503]